MDDNRSELALTGLSDLFWHPLDLKNEQKQKHPLHYFFNPNKHDNLKSEVCQIVRKHLLQVPCTCFDLSLTLFETSNLQKTKNKQENNSKNFISDTPY